MPPRQIAEDAIGDGERLLRRLLPNWIGPNGRPNEASVHASVVSVEREKYAGSPADTLSRSTRGEVAVAAVAFGRLPAVLSCDRVPDGMTAPENVETLVHHDREGHESHCNLGWVRAGETSFPVKPRKLPSLIRAQVHDKIVPLFEIVHALR